ncbi:MAG: hypothetical protein ACKO0W_08385, partial [Planctomycetota bacterium]
MLDRALAYLRREMTPSGLWRYWNRDAVWGAAGSSPSSPPTSTTPRAIRGFSRGTASTFQTTGPCFSTTATRAASSTPGSALERLSVIRGEDGRIARVRYVLPRHKAANWVGPGRGRKSTRPDASGVVELSPFEFLDRL